MCGSTVGMYNNFISSVKVTFLLIQKHWVHYISDFATVKG